MALKRKHAEIEEEAESLHYSSQSSQEGNSDDVDVADALADTIEVSDEDAAFIRQSIQTRNKKEGTEILKQSKKSKVKGDVGGGSFQSMGLLPGLLRALTLRGYRVPTPIQRLSIPSLLASPPRDLVGMARTGSGKTIAYMAPLIQRLNGRHSSVFGARALILVPARELALQVLKVGKELSRGHAPSNTGHAGDFENEESGRSSGDALRWGLIVGGEGMDEQFDMIATNPDVIIATPGRLLHLIVEMNLDLKSVQYVVFDEADRLFELGFATALEEILHRLPTARQTLLFSATLPKSLVDFAKAGLKNPKLVRLDVESKISADLRMAFFTVKQTEKDACLFSLLRDVIKVPLAAEAEKVGSMVGEKSKKGKGKGAPLVMAPHQTLIFTATKHHVSYLLTLLTTAGYSVSHIYGTLDQTARTLEMDRFRRGAANILVVTDVAARGIDIPILENVVNYDFPMGSRVFVHRVGRTARAGRKGWAWNFVTQTDLPYLLDLQLFLGRPLRTNVKNIASESGYVENLVLGTFSREAIDQEIEYVVSLDERESSLPMLREVMYKGQGMYERSKGKASQASYKRAKEMIKEGKWGFSGMMREVGVIHPLLRRHSGTAGVGVDEAKEAEEEEMERKKAALLAAVHSFRPLETVFELGSRGKSSGVLLMKDRRKALAKAVSRALPTSTPVAEGSDEQEDQSDIEMADENDIEDTFDIGKKTKSFRDEEFYLSHYQRDAHTEKGYSLNEGASSFAVQASRATFDLTTDEGSSHNRRAGASQLKWDRKKKKFIRGDGVGADNVKLVKTETGNKLPITYRSGRFDEWKAKNKQGIPKVGETEGPRAKNTVFQGKKWKHNKVQSSKPLDKLSIDYESKMRLNKKKSAPPGGEEDVQKKQPPVLKRGRSMGKTVGKVKNELKTADQIRKQRQLMEKKKAKNARRSRKGQKGR